MGLDLVKEFSQFGPTVALIALILIGAYLLFRDLLSKLDSNQKESAQREEQRYQERQQLNLKMLEVVAANTSAMQALRDVTAANCAQLDEHDERVGTIGQTVSRIDERTGRMEQVLTQVHQAVSGKRGN